MARKRRRSKFFWLVKLPIASVVAVVLGCNIWVMASTMSRVIDNPESIEGKPVGLVLGTSKKVAPDVGNPHFENRIAAAAELYLAGKVDRLIVSGHQEKYYDEPKDMIARLRDVYKIPESAVTPDIEGHRTLDSVIRAKKVFKCDNVVIISDDFHVNRALFIADHIGLKAVAYPSERVEFKKSTQSRFREYLARVKAVLDLYLLEPLSDKN
ncbi:MAG: SanA/YdcF family protein [Verrucomicrobiales bacterium]